MKTICTSILIVILPFSLFAQIIERDKKLITDKVIDKTYDLVRESYPNFSIEKINLKLLKNLQ